MALRRDTAFVGDHVNITVAPSNPYIEELPQLPSLSQQGQPPEEALEAPPHMLGVSPSSDVSPLLQLQHQSASCGCCRKLCMEAVLPSGDTAWL